uniref:alpha-amylase n=1 Tax=Sinocyclocheilus rhinocerous TaxID=307959 RepID=A0A673K3G2_9TELE
KKSLLILPALFTPNLKNGRISIVHLFEVLQMVVNETHNQADLPPSEHIMLTNPWKSWRQRYQMFSRSGTEEELRDTITLSKNVIVQCIYVDVVINHVCGSKFNGNKEDFPSVPYSYLDFNDGKCKTGSGHIENYHDIYQVYFLDLLDLALEKDYVRGKLAAYLNKLIDLGVAGFRVDACKHMWPGDLTNVYGRLKTLNTKWFPSGTKPFIYQEVIDLGGEPIKASEYYGLARVTEFKHSAKLGTVVRKWDGEKLSYLKNWGEGWGFMPSDRGLVFVDNHDNQRGHGAGGASVPTFWDSRLYKIVAGLMLAHPYGVTRVMSSYRWDRKNVNGKVIVYPINPDSTCGDNWVCEHRWRTFRNVVNGQPLSNWWDNGNNQIAFSHGSKGFIVINNDDWYSESQHSMSKVGENCIKWYKNILYMKRTALINRWQSGANNMLHVRTVS